MYRLTWLPKDHQPDEIVIAKAQYLPDIDRFVRDAFGIDGATQVVIVKED